MLRLGSASAELPGADALPSITSQVLTCLCCSWMTINTLNKLPSLKDLRFKACPLVESITSTCLCNPLNLTVNSPVSSAVSESRTQVIARVKSLQVRFFPLVISCTSLLRFRVSTVAPFEHGNAPKLKNSIFLKFASPFPVLLFHQRRLPQLS